MEPAARRFPSALPAYLLFLLSGAAGLLYEVLWSRELALVLGGSYPAVVAVVTAFLAGLAGGAALGGRFAARLRRPLRAYGILEAAIGLYCLAFPWLLAAAYPVFGACYRAFSGSPALHTASRFLVAAALLLPPTVAMGATLPVLLRHVVRSGVPVIGGTGFLYGLNTVGAAGGALLTGLVLLPAHGLRGTLWIGVATNAVVAALALWAARGVPDLEPEEAPAPAPAPAAPGAPALSAEGERALLFLAAGSGAAAMLYQLGWTKALVLFLGSSTHAFTLIVSAFILGLGAGGLLAPLVRARGPRLLLLLAAVEAGIGAAAWAGTASLIGLPIRVMETFPALRGDYAALLGWEFRQVLAVVLLPTMGMGIAFPILVAALSTDAGRASRSVGRVYAWNTAGTILGSLGGGMLLVPALGIRGALLVGTALNLGLGALVAAAALPRRAGALAAAGLLAGAALLARFAPPWPTERLNCGAYTYGAEILAAAKAQKRPVDRVLRDLLWDTVFFREGRTATVGVTRREDGSVFLRINGKTDAGTGDMETQVLLGQLPMLARPGARSALVVGLATGVSAAAVASHGPERLDVAEISPEVVEASRCFDPINGEVARRPGVRILLEDGRTHIEHGGGTYDVIVSEPTNPWIAGVSNLFTVEYFRACRERLSPDGVIAIWLQPYGISLEDFRLVIRTARAVFPGLTIWEMDPYGDYVLLAPKDDAADLVARVASREFPTGAAAESLALGGVRSREALLATLFLGREGTARFAGEGPLHTDDLLQLEFHMPRGVFGDAGYPTLSGPRDLDPVRDPSPVLAHAGPDPGPVRRALEARALAREGYLLAAGAGAAAGREEFLARLRADPALAETVLASVPATARDRTAAALRGGAPAAALEKEATLLVRSRAIALLEAALERSPGDRWAAKRLANTLLERGHALLAAGKLRDAHADFLRAAPLQPWNATIPFLAGDALLEASKGDPSSPYLKDALAMMDAALALNDHFEHALVDRGIVLALLGRGREAEESFRRALALRPDSIAAAANYAGFLVDEGRKDEARETVRRALVHEPGDPRLATMAGELGVR